MLFAALPAFAEEAAPAHWLKLVQPDHVCMVNNTAFEQPQIPVEVEGKTYYGCCMMCKERLEKDIAIRSAIDPVSGNGMDKSNAVIGKAMDNTVYYFESMENLKAFLKSEH